MQNDKEITVLPAISEEALTSFHDLTPNMIDIVIKEAERQFDESAFGHKVQVETLRKGLGWTFSMLESAMIIGDSQLLEDQIKWARVRLPVENINADYVGKSFKIIIEVIDRMMPKNQSLEINTYVRWMLDCQKKANGDKA